MTYFNYLNSFYRWLEDASPTDKVIVLYHALLDLFNRRGWPRWAGVDTQRLMLLARTTDKKTAFRARDALASAGFIAYRSGKKGKATEYCLLVFGSKFSTENAAGNITENITENAAGNITKNAAPNKTKKETKTKTISPLAPRDGGWGFGEELTAAFSDWLVYKQEKRQGYKPKGLQSLVIQVQKNAAQYGEAAVANLIRECMANNWQGIAWDLLKKSPAKTSCRHTAPPKVQEDMARMDKYLQKLREENREKAR